MKEKRKTIGTGILQPALENRFRVSIDVSDPDQHQRLMMQATSVVANYAKKEVTLTFEQDAITT